MKKLTNLPLHIRKIPNSKHYYFDSKNNKRIHKSKLESLCPPEPIDEEQKHELIISKRYDLRQD